MKKLLTLTLVIITSVAVHAQVWDGKSEAWTTGDGTAANPYLIEKPQHLAYLQETVSLNESYEGKYFLLTSDLDMGYSEGQKFKPIGFYDKYINTETSEYIDSSYYFLGNFDGGYHKITNVCIHFIDTLNSIGGTGLFACINKDAIIQNLIIDSNSVIEGTHGTGAIVGCMEGGTIKQCMNKASFDVSTDGMGQGGIVGSLYGGTVSECVNEGDLTGLTNVGGIAGYVDGDGTIENCYNKGSIKFFGFFAGGLVGYLAKSSSTVTKLMNSYNRGNVLNDYSGAAVVGTTDTGTEISNCYYVDLSAEQGAGDDNNGVTKKTEEEMKSDATLALLNQGSEIWEKDTKGINDGFPVLAWQNNVLTSISSVSESESDIHLKYQHGRLSVGCPLPVQIEVYSMNGSRVLTRTMNTSSMDWDAKGSFIIIAKKGQKQEQIKVVR
ncbi:MAG: GLUG motif-containing protein [Prevotella sp.]|jgi:hypothetical protein